MRISDWSSDVCSSDLNAVALVASPLDPPAMLIRLKAIEAAFGRRIGQRWGARTLDLDILLWSGGAWSDDRLTIPHPAMAERPFVLGPLTRIAPGWRHPIAARSIRKLATTPARAGSEEQTSEHQYLMRPY